MTIVPFAGAQRLPVREAVVFSRRHFLAADECAALVARIDAERRPSGLADQNGDPGFRTSETCDLSGDDPLVAGITRRLAAYAGLDASHAEPLQGQRYALGQEFKAHTDTFEPDGADYDLYCSVAGQRTWTLMVYLNEPEAGGATRFKQLDKIVQPETGKLLAWNNLLPDGRPNYATLHQGMPVRGGTKYIITSWFRQKPWR
ncbi:prolyl hydroxylase family protein [Sandarakinorhabdus sp. DWP1-3-1]|uniref:prolyl hydroxylase family protein n=1 Tax=Sandarakinorhabdus sp. DWP1-3-1 TaxID=2804627 RepID=UPI003CEC52AF